MNRLMLFFFLLISLKINAQETLPNFRVTQLSENKVRVYWKNSFANCTQITIQKSYDSLKYFKTIFSSLSPELPENAYVDNDYLPELKIYYRILYVIDDGIFAFTLSKTPSKSVNIQNEILKPKIEESIKLFRLITINKPLISKKDSSLIVEKNNSNKEKETTKIELKKIHILDSIVATPLPTKRMFVIYKGVIDSLFTIIDEYAFSKFKDSIISKTKDTLYAYENDIIVWKKFIPDPIWQASEFVYTAPKGFVIIQLPLYKKHKYKLICFNENKEELFRIKQIKTDYLMLEKSNFNKAGWFSFELYEDDKLKEKNKFFIQADF